MVKGGVSSQDSADQPAAPHPAPAAPNPAVRRIATESFAAMLGVRLVACGEDRVVVELPYSSKLGVGRIHGGAISALIDIAATAAFWACPRLGGAARGATVGFTVQFLNLAVATTLTATAQVRRRGGTLCVGDVSVRDAAGDEVAAALVTYKLTGYSPAPSAAAAERAD